MPSSARGRARGDRGIRTTLTGELERVSAALADAETARQALAGARRSRRRRARSSPGTRQEAPEDRFGEQARVVHPVTKAHATRASSAEVLRTSREAEVRATRAAVALARRREELSGRLGTTTAELDRLGTDSPGGRGLGDRRGQPTTADLGRLGRGGVADLYRRNATRRRPGSRRSSSPSTRPAGGMERLSAVSGVVGTLLDVVEVDDLVLAFEAAVEGVLDRILVQGGPSARAAVERLRTAGSGGSILPLLPSGAAAGPTPSVPPGAEALRQAVRAADPAVAALLDRLIGEVEVVRAGPEAVIEQAALADPGCTIVTPEGDRFSPFGWRIGARTAGATRAALDAARTTDGEAARAVEHADDPRRRGPTRAGSDARRGPGGAARRRPAARRAGERRTARAGIVRHLELVAEEEAAAAAEQAAAAAARQQAEQAWVEAEDTLTGVEQAEKAELTRASQAVAARRGIGRPRLGAR